MDERTKGRGRLAAVLWAGPGPRAQQTGGGPRGVGPHPSLALKVGRCLPWLPRQDCPPSSRALASLPAQGPTTQLLFPPPEACPAPLLDREAA